MEVVDYQRDGLVYFVDTVDKELWYKALNNYARQCQRSLEDITSKCSIHEYTLHTFKISLTLGIFLVLFAAYSNWRCSAVVNGAIFRELFVNNHDVNRINFVENSIIAGQQRTSVCLWLLILLQISVLDKYFIYSLVADPITYMYRRCKGHTVPFLTGIGVILFIALCTTRYLLYKQKKRSRK